MDNLPPEELETILKDIKVVLKDNKQNIKDCLVVLKDIQNKYFPQQPNIMVRFYNWIKKLFP